MKKNYLLIALLILSNLLFTGCELFEDIHEDNSADTRSRLIGLWKNDSLETKYYENGVLTGTDKQSLVGYTFEVKKDDTYINTNPMGVAYVNGTWELIKWNQTEQIILDAKTGDERKYTILKLTKNRLVTNRKVNLSETFSAEYTFSYNRK